LPASCRCWSRVDEVVIALVRFGKKAIGMFSKQARQHAARHCCARRDAPTPEEVKLIRGTDRICQIAQRPDIAEGVTGATGYLSAVGRHGRVRLLPARRRLCWARRAPRSFWDSSRSAGIT
jgi:hypothetical protein